MPPRARGGDAASAAPSTPVRAAGGSREIVHLNSSTPGKKRAVGTGASASPTSYGVKVKELTSKFIGTRKFGSNMVVTLVYRVDDLNDDIVIDDLPTCAQAMVKWSGQGVGKIAYNYKEKKKSEGIEYPTLLHSAFKGMVFVMVQCLTRNECLLSVGALHKFYGDHRYLPRQQVVEEGKCFIEPNSFVSCADFANEDGDFLFKDLKTTTWETLGNFYSSNKNDLGATFEEIAISIETWNAFCEADNALQLQEDKSMSNEALDEM